MKRRIILKLLPVICLLLQLSIQAQETPPVTLHVATAGTLPDLIAANDKYRVTNLTLTGKLNGTDILYIREMAGRDVNGNQTVGKLSVLDLSGADIVSGGAVYYIYNSNYSFYTNNDSIGDNTFYNCNQLTSVTVPNSVSSIGVSAFWGCTQLDSVIIPNSVKSIGVGAFSGCTGLTFVSIPNSVTSIGEYVFYECTGLTSITIPNSVTSVGTNAFRSCTGLTSVILSDSLISIGVATFGDCTGLTSVTIPNSVTSIGMGAFSGCSGLTSVSIGNNVKSIEYGAFYECTGLTSFAIPNSVTALGGNAFYGCSGLKSITLSNSLISIETGTFSGCTGLTSISVPNGVNTIKSEAFFDCSGLTSVTIAHSVNSISEYAFYGCISLGEIHSNNPIPPTLKGSGAFQGVNKTTCILYVPKGSYDSYRATNYWSEFLNIVEEDVSTSVKDISYRNITVYASHNKVNIETDETISVSIYYVSGKKVFEGVVGNKTVIPLNGGVYIVRTANESRKVIVY